LWRGFLEPDLSLASVRTIVDLVLTAAIAVSLWRRQPFSLQYAGSEGWREADFIRVNYVISLVWLCAFAAMALVDAGVVLALLPFYAGIAAGVVALAFSITFTLRYPARVQRPR
jgi:hypothetical protein